MAYRIEKGGPHDLDAEDGGLRGPFFVGSSIDSSLLTESQFAFSSNTHPLPMGRVTYS